MSKSETKSYAWQTAAVFTKVHVLSYPSPVNFCQLTDAFYVSSTQAVGLRISFEALILANAVILHLKKLHNSHKLKDSNEYIIAIISHIWKSPDKCVLLLLANISSVAVAQNGFTNNVGEIPLKASKCVVGKCDPD